MDAGEVSRTVPVLPVPRTTHDRRTIMTHAEKLNAIEQIRLFTANSNPTETTMARNLLRVFFEHPDQFWGFQLPTTRPGWQRSASRVSLLISVRV